MKGNIDFSNPDALNSILKEAMNDSKFDLSKMMGSKQSPIMKIVSKIMTNPGSLKNIMALVISILAFAAVGFIFSVVYFINHPYAFLIIASSVLILLILKKVFKRSNKSNKKNIPL